MTEDIHDEKDWNTVLSEFTTLYLEEKDVDREKEELENYPLNPSKEIDEEEFWKYQEQIRNEIDELAEE